MADYYNQSINDYLTSSFGVSMGRQNTFGYFIEKGCQSLLRQAGLLSYIVPNTLLTQEYYQSLRLRILENELKLVATFTESPFKGAVVEATVFVLSRKLPEPDHQVKIVLFDSKSKRNSVKNVAQETFRVSHNNAILVHYDESSSSIKERMKLDRMVPLGSIFNINQAIALKEDRKASLFDAAEDDRFKKVLDGREIRRYSIEWRGSYLLYDVNKIHSCKRTDIFEADAKIFMRRVGESLIATYDDQQFYALNTLIVVTPKIDPSVNLKFLLAFLNSKLANYYYRTFLKSNKKVFSEVQARQLAQLSIRTIDFDNPADKKAHDTIVKHVETMLQLHRDLQSATLPHDKEQIQRRIEHTDRQIDALVYELYGLIEEEIRIVEGK